MHRDMGDAESVPMKKILLLLWLIPAASQAEKMGRLFFTPEQREAMERRHQKPGQPARPEGQAEAAGSLEARGGGKTVWVDGVPRQIEPGKKK